MSVEELKSQSSSTEKNNVDIEINDINDVSTGEEDLYIDPAAESALLRKLDLNLMPIFGCVYFLSMLDRSNIGNAKIAGMFEQLHLTNQEFSTAVSIFYATYVSVEIPGTIIMKAVGAKTYLSAAMMAWSLVTLFTCFVRSYASLCVVRVLLGLFEGGVFPALALYISFFYKPREQTRRYGYLFLCSCLSGAFTGLIATGITKIKPHGNFLSWSWLFVIEGAISVVLVAMIWFFLPDDPADAKFLNAEEKNLMRIRRNQMIKYTGATKKLEFKEAINAWKDPFVWISCVIQFCLDIVGYGFSTFLPSILKLQLGYDTMQAQYLTIPVFVVAAIGTYTFCNISDRVPNSKYYVIGGLSILSLVGYIILLTDVSGGVKYFACYLIGFTLYGTLATNFASVATNQAPNFRKTIAVGTNQTLGNVAGAIVGQVYRSAPYKLGNGFSLGCVALAIILSAVQRALCIHYNKVKEEIQAGTRPDTMKERTGSNALDFRYLY